MTEFAASAVRPARGVTGGPTGEIASDVLSRLNVRYPGEGDDFWRVYWDLAGEDSIRGNLVTGSLIAALMLHHGVSTIYTADRDFRRFPGITSLDLYSLSDESPE